MSAMRSMPADAGLLSLQQEALQRVRQMQQRARLAVEGRTGENTPPPSAQAAPAPAPFSPRGASSQPPGAAPAPASLPPQGAAPPNPSMPGGDAQRSGPQRAFRPPNPPPFAGQRPQRSSGAENILSQLFGGTRQQSRRQAPGGRRPGKAERGERTPRFDPGRTWRRGSRRSGGQPARLDRFGKQASFRPARRLLDRRRKAADSPRYVGDLQRAQRQQDAAACTGISAAVMRAVPAVQRQRPPRTKAAGAFPVFVIFS